MKTPTFKTFAIATLLVCSNYSHADVNIRPFAERQLIKICQAAKDNNVTKMNKLVRMNEFSYKKLQRDIKCNGQSLMDFAIENQAEDAAKYIAKKARITEELVLTKLSKSQSEESYSDS